MTCQASQSPPRWIATGSAKMITLAPKLAVAWLDEIGAAFGGEPAWSGDAMRRLLAAIEPLLIPLAYALASGRDVEMDESGCIHIRVPQPWHRGQDRDHLDISYDPSTFTWETSDAIGRDIVGLLAKCHRAYSGRELGPLDGATCLAACLGLAFLRVQEDRKRARKAAP